MVLEGGKTQFNNDKSFNEELDASGYFVGGGLRVSLSGYFQISYQKAYMSEERRGSIDNTVSGFTDRIGLAIKIPF